MKTSYAYLGESGCQNNEGQMQMSMFGDASREERVSFNASFESPLLYRDAMLALREVVIHDGRPKVKDRTDFFNWLEGEIERRVALFKTDIQNEKREKAIEKEQYIEEANVFKEEINTLRSQLNALNKEKYSHKAWQNYKKKEQEFWKYIYTRDRDLWFVLDPVITVHEDIVSFEAFSLDESIYGCLTVEKTFFKEITSDKLGTTNIDFSDKLAKELGRFRTFNDAKLTINPEGMTVDTQKSDEYLEKKIDLPESWIKGFSQVSSAGFLNGNKVSISTIDMYDICHWMRRNKAKESPRYMKWSLEPGKHIEITFMPHGDTLTLKSIYKGEKRHVEKVWGRRRWLIIEQTLPFASSYDLTFLGFGLPQFVTANAKGLSLTYGFTSWQANDWVSGTSFNVLAGFVGDSHAYEKVYKYLQEVRCISYEALLSHFSDESKTVILKAIGMMFKKGEGYFDTISSCIRFRRLFNFEVPKELYTSSLIEKKTEELIQNQGIRYEIKKDGDGNIYVSNLAQNMGGKDQVKTEIVLTQEGFFSKVKCSCKTYQSGARNISDPCEHILALYCQVKKVLHLEFEVGKTYNADQILERFL